MQRYSWSNVKNSARSEVDADFCKGVITNIIVDGVNDNAIAIIFVIVVEAAVDN